MRRIASVVCLTLILAGCVSTSDQAPLTYQINASSEAAKAAIVSVYAQEGFMVQSDSPHQIAMQRARGGGSALRHSFSITGSNPATAYGSISVVDNPGSGLEKANDFTWYGEARSLMTGYMQKVQSIAGK